MIPSEQTAEGLRVIQSLIVQARHAAYTAGAKEVGDLLDDIELLPEFLGDPQDRSQEFRDMLDGIAQKHPQCRHVIDAFGRQPVRT